MDEGIDWRLARELVGHDIKTVPEMGWAGVENGALLSLAAAAFDVFVTVDRNLSFQQHLPKFHIAVLALHGSSNRLLDLRPLVPKILTAIPTLTKGEAAHLGI